MNQGFRKVLAFVGTTLFTLTLLACGPAVLPQTATPTTTVDDSVFMTAQMGSTLAAMLTETAAPCSTCSTESISLTAAMATAFASTPSNTPPAGVTLPPRAGDLGWGSVYGVILDGITMKPIEGATVRCEQASYVIEYRCHGVTTTNQDGVYSFNPIFFHDTDRITLTIDAPGYVTVEYEQSSFTQAELHGDFGLFTVESLTVTPPPLISCTPPACTNGVLACGLEAGCPGGCGTVCTSPTPTP
jgi:hypothetical protein